MAKDNKPNLHIPITHEAFVEALINTNTRQEIEKAQKGFLCMFSGGVDSTGMLHALLNNPNYSHFDVYVHHIRIINREQRHIVELNAVRNIIKYYKDLPTARQIDYKESEINIEFMKESWSGRMSFDVDLITFMAAQICLCRPGIKYVGLGLVRDDIESVATGASDRSLNVPKIFDAALYGFGTQIPKPQLIYPVQRLTKRELWHTLPPQIQKLTWSCRTPKLVENVFQRCGRCHSCVIRIESGIDR